ncbi:polyprenol phosphomannose-dependent alpha 1,6 mannosyltransferase MptB [Micromonospora halophytica]|uniref:Alpha-1,6-mannosyltransferase n=1 Tax=Micromonospora halophytica TaxID=47864 RepID=A0A1C5GYB1_9ACTN|nr:polyprenol phosphomannose-dependent alpha 1,6 mannosyltransferase MptB [Micromonospora halophytica]SCG38785.1 alpha-1,6-mannosyltransferase [Micromonospora halophytica]
MTEPGSPSDARARSARYAGLAGAALLTVAAWLGGAMPTVPPVGPGAMPYGPAALGCWLLGTALMVGAWWSLRHGAPSTRWAYRTAGLWLLPLLAAPPLASRDVYSYACQGWAYAAGHDPYTLGVAAAGCPWVDSVAPIWRDTPAPYGPLFLLLAAVAATLGGGLVGTLALLRSFAVAGVLLAALCLPGLARACGVPARRAAWLGLASPLVGVHLVAGAHNDAVMLGLLLLGLLVLVRLPGRPRALLAAGQPRAPLAAGEPRAPLAAGQPRAPLAAGEPRALLVAGQPGALLAAGVLLGLAVGVKATAVVVLPFAALVAVRGRYAVGALLRDGGLLAGGAATALVVLSVLSGLGLGWIGGLARSGDSQQWTSPPTAVGFVVDYLGELVGREPGAVPVARAAGLVLLAVLLVVLWWWTWAALRGRDAVVAAGERPSTTLVVAGGRRRTAVAVAGERPRTALVAAGVALAATVALAPVVHPWYATWPLLVLAVSATRTTWFTLPCAAAAFLTLPDGTSLARYTKAPGAIAMTALLLVLAVRQLRRPGEPGPT